MRGRARQGRWRRSAARSVLATACATLLLSACAHNHEALEKRLTALETELSELRRGDRSVAVRLEDVENRLLLLRDELDTRQTVLYRDRFGAGSGAATAVTYGGAPATTYGGAPAPAEPAPLPTVRLKPPEPPPAAPSTATEPFTYDAIDAYGYRVSPDTETAPPTGGLEDAPLAVASDPPAPTGLAPAAPALSPKDQRRAAGEYKKAYALVKKGRYDRAQKRLEAFVERWPTHGLADNALYWLGECLYAQKKYLEALQAFQRVIRDYPDGNKVPDSMLKTGLCYQNLGEATQARKVLLQVAEIYPSSGAAQIALERAQGIR